MRQMDKKGGLSVIKLRNKVHEIRHIGKPRMLANRRRDLLDRCFEKRFIFKVQSGYVCSIWALCESFERKRLFNCRSCAEYMYVVGHQRLYGIMHESNNSATFQSIKKAVGMISKEPEEN